MSAEAEAGPETGTDAASRTRRGLYVGFVVVALAVGALDQASKYWAESALADGRVIDGMPFFSFHLVYNPGAAFSLGENSTWIFTITTGLTTAGLLYFGRRLTSLRWVLALGVLLGGAASHFGDRLFRAPGPGRGHVVDFIDYNGFFVGNVADIAIVGAAAAIVLLSALGVPHDDRTPKPDASGEERTPEPDVPENERAPAPNVSGDDR
ncbi:signal peptidase II [Actinomadura flavalba]|uniref:signal peptidase II n=1 Tax=Actinomadura flavalba TaxID=1120938 RepID=UPI000381CFC2|nr:signal peptidase II [Actinomadura flavalba]